MRGRAGKDDLEGSPVLQAPRWGPEGSSPGASPDSPIPSPRQAA